MLVDVFNTYLNPQESVYVDIIHTLNVVFESIGFAQKIRFKSNYIQRQSTYFSKKI